MENVTIGHYLKELNPNMIDVTKSLTLPTLCEVDEDEYVYLHEDFKHELARKEQHQKGDYVLAWTKNGTYGIHSCIFLGFLILMFNVLGMQICPFESRRQMEDLNLKLLSFHTMTCVSI